MTVVDLEAPGLTWREHPISGSDRPASMVLLRTDPEAATRTVLVRFPDGWSRDAVGHQPAAEEMVVLSGALRISGLTCAAGSTLHVEPLATRSATSVDDGTTALVWFAGPAGWAAGAAAEPGAMAVRRVGPALHREATPAIPGSLAWAASAPAAPLDVDADLLWPRARAWAHVPAGGVAPRIAGPVVVRRWA